MDELEELMARIDKFNKDRDWDKFHTPVNLSKSILIEAAELLECFQWDNDKFNLEDAKALVSGGCQILAEGANMPTELDAIKYLMANGVIFSPGKASNAGGVAVSGLEMSQNAQHLSWTFEEVDNKLKAIMKNIFDVCYQTASKFGEPTNLAMGANIAGFLKVKDAMIKEGLV